MVIIKSYSHKSIILKFIVFIEVLIYVSFIYLDYTTNLKSMQSPILKYIGILLCLSLAILVGKSGHDKKDTMLLRIAFFFTAAADLCMVILDFDTLGIMIFCLVQITYIVRHRRGGRKKGKLNLLILITIIVILISVLFVSGLGRENLGDNGFGKFTIAIGSVYAVLLSYSVYTGWKTIKGNFYPIYSRYLILIGITLFLLCDINVALSSIADNLFIMNTNIGNVFRFLIWIFYLPSQVLLVLSGYSKNLR